ncbi:hypothetical protein B0T19DRAFT_356053 [Cercophora scortea]|uniref:PHD-type domain-containing protein n=1 Tax=Cercophora scortea TaxID=314031 RepID=A0AAE0IZK1_9PEZI|nr:hypothetical protein B0T19DRAFT_356053 [Cercophora scortea]
MALSPPPNASPSPPSPSSPIEHAVQSIGSMKNNLSSLDMRADPDAQATVTDFLDFTEYLPSDMMRSLTLIGKLDQTYAKASAEVHDLTTLWGKLPTIPPADRAGPVELRARISEKLSHAVSSRTYAHAEAVRMSENLHRHFNRAKTILGKLEIMRDNYPAADEHKSPVATIKSPHVAGAPKIALRMDGQRVRRQRVPRITVPGEVLAPYELNYEPYSSESESSSSEEEDEEPPPPTRITPAPSMRIKVAKPVQKPTKPAKIPKPRASLPPPGPSGIPATGFTEKLQPPPENAVIGSADAPWGQLTGYELARLRKRMKKNAAWTPSDTMVARELSDLGRGVDAFRAAKQKAEEEGRVFEGKMPVPIVDPETGDPRMPLGALAMDALDEKNLSNRGMKLNEAKKLKRELLAKMAAEEAEESARQLEVIARTLMSEPSQTTVQDPTVKMPAKAKPPPKKRKRDSVAETDAEKPELTEGQAQRPQFKRNKTETPVPPPQMTPSAAQPSQETPVQPPQRIQAPVVVMHSTTPIPLPIHGQDQSITAKSGASVASATSPAPSNNNAGPSSAVPTLAPVKLPTSETPIPPPVHSPKKSTTPILPPVRETRKSQAARLQEQQKEAPASLTIKPPSRAASPAPLTPKPDPDPQPSSAVSATARRPASRGKAMSQEPQPSLAADRPRRTSTARNTPAPERGAAETGTAAAAAAASAGAGAGALSSSSTTMATRPISRRMKRPAPGVISQTIGGSNSAVGKRKAAPKKNMSARAGKPKDKAEAAVAGGGGEVHEVEVDDEGNVIDMDEPRYCQCNRVSFGTMIQCDNPDNCPYEWFHLECVDLVEVPARTTKWYCPDCRISLNIGEKGEVTARGVKA